MIAWLPALRLAIVKLAEEPPSGKTPRLVAPSKNSTLPVAADPLTVAVKVTSWPKIDGFRPLTSVVVVGALFTICVSAATLISAYKNGRRVPGGDALLRLIEACGGSLDTTTTVERGRDAAAQLEQVSAIAMALPRRKPGPLAYPTFRQLRAG